MYDYILLAIPRIQDQLHHVTNAVMTGICGVFCLDMDDDKDSISLKKNAEKRSSIGKLFKK